jgi:YVTN family beta-propeller protein
VKRHLGLGSVLLVVAVVLLAWWRASPAQPPTPPEQRAWRRPVALALSGDGKQLLVANRARGSVSVVDTEKQRVADEVAVGARLADLVVLPDGRVLAVDEEAHELVLLGHRDATLEVVGRLKVPAYPVCVRASGDGRLGFVASLWSRQLSIVDLSAPRSLTLRKTVGLSFPPRLVLPLPDTDRLVVTDAFGGRLAVVDAGKGAVESVRELPGHNIRGLALTADGKELLVAHQLLSARAQTTEDDIHWGNLIANRLRTLRVAAVLDPRADLLEGSYRYDLGRPGRGAGDPAGLAVAGGRTVVTLGGVGEVVLGAELGGAAGQVAVGRRPTAVTVSPDGRRAYVADTLADAVAVVGLSDVKVEATIDLGKKPDASPVDRGEVLFYDARLSFEGWLSCHSCHTDGHTNGLLADTLGDGDFGAPKRVLSLHGVKDTGPWAWDGSVAALGEQVRKSITLTMRGTATDEQVRDLTAYLESLPPLAPLPGNDEAVGRGRAVFQRQGCVSCHTPPTYTTARTFDVGLADEHGRKMFNPPSLRGVGHGGSFFHDGRAATLEEVVTRQRHQVKGDLSEAEQADLLSFLRSL